MAFLTPDNIRVEHGLEIKEKIIPWGARWPKNSGKYRKGDLFKADRLLSGGTGKVEYVTVHNTEDIAEARGTNDAEQYTRATWPNANMADVRVHYYIDETDCWQNLREDEVGWHAGDGNYGPGNDTSLAIEIIMDGSGSAADRAAEDRGALLAAILLDRHGLGIDRLKAHKDWSGKFCPIYILPHWAQFVAKVEAHLAVIRGREEGSTYMLELPLLARDDRGDQVKALQMLLIGYGYSCGSSGVDGSFGPATENAVICFQEDCGLLPDGIVGPDTMGSLLGC